MTDLAQLVQSVVPLLDIALHWHVVSEAAPHIVHGDGGRELSFTIATKPKGWLYVTGILPNRGAEGRFVDTGTGTPPQIAFPPSKTAGGVAEAIERTLLPAYELALANARQVVDAFDQRVLLTRQTIEMIRALVPGILGGNKGSDGANATIFIRDGKVWGDVHALAARIDLNIRGLSRSTGLRVLALIQELEAQETV